MKETDKNLKCRSCLSECDSTLKSCPSWFFSFVFCVLDIFGPESSVENIDKTNLQPTEKRHLISDYRYKITVRCLSRIAILLSIKIMSKFQKRSSEIPREINFSFQQPQKKQCHFTTIPSDHFYRKNLLFSWGESCGTLATNTRDFCVWQIWENYFQCHYLILPGWEHVFKQQICQVLP